MLEYDLLLQLSSLLARSGEDVLEGGCVGRGLTGLICLMVRWWQSARDDMTPVLLLPVSKLGTEQVSLRVSTLTGRVSVRVHHHCLEMTKWWQDGVMTVTLTPIMNLTLHGWVSLSANICQSDIRDDILHGTNIRDIRYWEVSIETWRVSWPGLILIHFLRWIQSEAGKVKHQMFQILGLRSSQLTRWCALNWVSLSWVPEMKSRAIGKSIKRAGYNLQIVITFLLSLIQCRIF